MYDKIRIKCLPYVTQCVSVQQDDALRSRK